MARHMTNKHGTDLLDRWRASRDQALNTLRRLDAAKCERNRAIIQQARDTLRRTDLAERARRRAIIAEAREKLRRGQPMPPQNHIQRERRLVIEKAREALRFWQRKAPRAPSAAETKSIDDRIAAAFEARAWLDAARTEAVGQALGEVRKQLRGELAKLKSETDMRISALLAEMDKLKHVSGDVRGEVIDMPKVLDRRNAA